MIRIGTRGSALARWQAEWVAARLAAMMVEVELIFIKTSGDGTTTPISAAAGQGVFTKEIQRALLEAQIDLAVHSLKDLPTEPVAGLTLAAVPLRESPHDALISHVASSLEQLPLGARVGTGSRRRQSQLLHLRPDLRVEDTRGNVETRLRKLDEGEFDAIVLAEAGLSRLGLADRITQLLPLSIMLPAVGQGALGLETRVNDAEINNLLTLLDDQHTHVAVSAERAMLAALRGGCLAPIGAWGRVVDRALVLDGGVFSLDGTARLAATASGSLEEAEAVGQQVAHDLLQQGAGALIDQSRQS